MSTTAERHATLICRYPIASSEMYYSELGQREVYVSDDPQRGFRVWGEMMGAGEVSAISLCEVFLEYAMFCQPWSDETQAYYMMESFGTGLGEALAQYISDNVLMGGINFPGACALECLLETLNMNFTIHQMGKELRFIICDCPFDEIAQQSGMPHSELVHVSINALCQSLMHAIQPELPVFTPVDDRVDHIFAMATTNAISAA